MTPLKIQACKQVLYSGRPDTSAQTQVLPRWNECGVTAKAMTIENGCAWYCSQGLYYKLLYSQKNTYSVTSSPIRSLLQRRPHEPKQRGQAKFELKHTNLQAGRPSAGAVRLVSFPNPNSMSDVPEKPPKRAQRCWTLNKAKLKRPLLMQGNADL